MKNLDALTIGQIVACDSRCQSVFETYRINFYNHGEKTLDEVALEKGTTKELLINDLTRAMETTNQPENNFDSLEMDALTAHIIEHYHQPAEKEIAQIKATLELLSVTHPELNTITQLFNSVAGQIAVHQKKEELILFPYIRKMANALRNQQPFVRPPLTKSAENPVNMLTHEHHDQGIAFEKIAQLSDQYTASSTAEEPYQLVMKALKEFELRLHTHLHLENNILFPKALEADKKLSA